MSIATPRHTVQEYFEVELASELRHEYIDGEIIPMTGGTLEHNLICNNLLLLLMMRFRFPDYWVCSGNTRVKVDDPDEYLFPDAAIVAGPGIRETAKLDTILNPLHVFEVLSDSTERQARGSRFDMYKRIASVEKYILISQTDISIECHSRQANGEWEFQNYSQRNDAIPFDSLGWKLELAELYRNFPLV